MSPQEDRLGVRVGAFQAERIEPQRHLGLETAIEELGFRHTLREMKARIENEKGEGSTSWKVLYAMLG